MVALKKRNLEGKIQEKARKREASRMKHIHEEGPLVKEILNKKPKFKLIEENYSKVTQDELQEKIDKMNEEKSNLKKPMDFEELKDFAAKFEIDKIKIQEDKKVGKVESESKTKKVADFYEELLSKFPKKSRKKPEGHEEDCECTLCADIDKIDYYEIEAQVKMI